MKSWSVFIVSCFAALIVVVYVDEATRRLRKEHTERQHQNNTTNKISAPTHDMESTSRKAEYIRELACLMSGQLISECIYEKLPDRLLSEAETLSLPPPSNRVSKRRRPGQEDSFYSGW